MKYEMVEPEIFPNEALERIAYAPAQLRVRAKRKEKWGCQGLLYSTDIHYYRLMQAWKSNTNIDFNFTDCQLRNEIHSENEVYIKHLVRQRISTAGKYLMLIGQDTKYKYKYVRWEAEVAIEKGCTIIGVNLDGSRRMVDKTCPPIIRGIGAMFVPFSPQIVAYAIENYKMHEDDNYHYKDSVYKQLGY